MKERGREGWKDGVNGTGGGERRERGPPSGGGGRGVSVRDT